MWCPRVGPRADCSERVIGQSYLRRPLRGTSARHSHLRNFRLVPPNHILNLIVFSNSGSYN
jgi:hypothetical protein